METITDIQKLPELDGASIHIWGVHVPDMHDRLAALRGVLSEKEQEKAARFRRETDRESSIIARGALRVLLSGYTGIPAAGLDFHYSENGKPHVADSNVEFNLSHSGDWVVLAFGRSRNIGVDVEKIKWTLDVESIAARYFAPEEIALIENAVDRHSMFFQLWARKEAYVKACGSTLFSELSSFSVPIEDRGERDGWIFQRLEAGSQYAAAVVTDQKLANVPCYDFGGLAWSV
ncbi:MAG: 4'-phosphopantetheinyl transferase superfamily protein [Kiritimatiellales bacterium]|nr:4'-phosphopantetheinyl transferase superfamily protein [Kiritimatiellales bacterium]MCF7863288.1 4'-phosphopantetheinyl transferase superfamily protein [Kiritimatiellales bacterium]